MIAAALAAAMLAGWAAGWWWGRRQPKAASEAPASKFNDASMAILGLLLAFTFSMSLSKHDQRRLMVVTDSNSIGDFYTCASLVQEPVRQKLQGEIRAYVEHRLALAKERIGDPESQKSLHEIQELQNRMQALVSEAIAGGTPVVVPLVNTLNEVTSSHAARLAAVRDRLAPSIVMLLFLSAIISMALMGAQQGASGEHHFGATLGFVILVSLVVYVTLDLNQPQRGLITVSQEPMQRLLAGMGE